GPLPESSTHYHNFGWGKRDGPGERKRQAIKGYFPPGKVHYCTAAEGLRNLGDFYRVIVVGQTLEAAHGLLPELWKSADRGSQVLQQMWKGRGRAACGASRGDSAGCHIPGQRHSGEDSLDHPDSDSS